jgi:BirA family biotin operon repressor/biotin-[acetyl-CoA-carboxylase] ligase
MTRRAALVAALADGRVHDTAALATRLGCDEAALRLELAGLSDWQLAVETPAPGQCRLESPLDRLDARTLTGALATPTRECLDRLEVLDEVDSTNAVLLGAEPPATGRFRVLLAEFQRAGRGRRGRRWHTPYAHGLCLSIATRLRTPAARLGTLSLVAGVAVLRALAGAGITGISLKWPNDLLRADAKLGGILSEMRSLGEDESSVVVGVGLNVRAVPGLQSLVHAEGGLAPADLGDFGPPSRARLAAALVDALVAATTAFGEHGFAPFAAEWSAADALRDRWVRVQGTTAVREGIARGIDAGGGLRVEFRDGTEVLTAGDVSLRSAA